MNTSNLKRYAPKARRDFIAAVSKQAAKYGVTKDKVHPIEVTGDVTVINGKPFPAKLAPQIKKLGQKVQSLGYDQTMEQVAYSWFNRLIAIRYMELHGYLDHGRRVLSHPNHEDGFQILDECTDISYGEGGQLPHLTHEKVVELKLDGTKDEELYRELLLAQCHALHTAMPFLFEAVDDETELLLPENLTKTDSLIKDMVKDVPEEDWKDVEVVGWLYQFYISEKKSSVMGKVVKSEDIPAATQLFTPAWIVKYLVQNSVGRIWINTYPDSSILNTMDYFIKPSTQNMDVQSTLDEITPKEIDPEEIKILDPAMGSGHILIEAYKILKAIYEERGYRKRDIPEKILENNLYGLDIDDRAAQLSGFALLMLARNDDRRIFSKGIQLNLSSIQETKHIDLKSNWEDGQFEKLLGQNSFSILESLWEAFEDGKTYGSLINIEHEMELKLKDLLCQLVSISNNGEFLQRPAAKTFLPIVKQALILSYRFDACIANPPYMGSGAMNKLLKSYCSNHYPNYKLDTYAAFTKAALNKTKSGGYSSIIAMHSWMFVFKFEGMRNDLLNTIQIDSMLHLGTRAFAELSGEVVQTAATVFRNIPLKDSNGTYIRLVDGESETKKNNFLTGNCQAFKQNQHSFIELPGQIICYWANENEINHLCNDTKIIEIGNPRHGMVTSDNNRFTRQWWEVSISDIGLKCESRFSSIQSGKKWFPYNKGGSYRKWYGNNDLVVNWENDGEEIFALATEMYGSPSRKLPSQEFYFKSGLTWSALSSDNISLRMNGEGYLFDSKGSSVFFDDKDETTFFLGYLNSRVAARYLNLLCPTLDYNAGSVGKLPVPRIDAKKKKEIIERTNEIHKLAVVDCQANLLYFNNTLPKQIFSEKSVQSSHQALNTIRNNHKDAIRNLIIKNDLDFCSALDVSPSDLFEIDERDFGFAEITPCDFVQILFNLSIDCMMGRSSIISESLVYASAEGIGFKELAESGAYGDYEVDEDGIVPLTNLEWFSDDATNRFIDLVRTVWGGHNLDENLSYICSSLFSNSVKAKKGESAQDTIRRYLSTQFYKDHCKTYKKRPIYWLFSSGKQKAFECLVYIHRYNEGTLSRMRTEYVIPLTSKIASHVEKLEKDKEASESAAESKRIEKEIALLHKQQAELAEFDEKLKHFADQRIKLDLDDGVKENYGKFGDLLADVKAIHGKAV